MPTGIWPEMHASSWHLGLTNNSSFVPFSSILRDFYDLADLEKDVLILQTTRIISRKQFRGFRRLWYSCLYEFSVLQAWRHGVRSRPLGGTDVANSDEIRRVRPRPGLGCGLFSCVAGEIQVGETARMDGRAGWLCGPVPST